MPKLALEDFVIGKIDWDLTPSPIEEMFLGHDPLDQFHRYYLVLKKTPTKYWEDADPATKMWSDGVYINGKGDFRQDWYCLPQYLIHEIMRVFGAKVIIAQVQAEAYLDQDLVVRFEGNPKKIDVKLAVYLDYKIENPTSFLTSISRKMSSTSFAPDHSFSQLVYESESRECIGVDPDEEEVKPLFDSVTEFGLRASELERRKEQEENE